ncbi:MAG: tetratricopeptide repeat protein [Nanoarchaeota archaeon]|nr:tetratricopeptide repeat protein [Nanoarchaeota archaeon]
MNRIIAKRKSKKKNSSKKRKIPFVLMFPIILVGLFFLAELLLFIAYSATGSSKFETLSDYPAHPDEYVKIAVFGCSATAGWASEKPFATILEYDLKQTYPDLNIYIKNYAETGHPFHRHQAELMKSVIDEYDFFIIYPDNCEGRNYLIDTNFAVKEEYKKYNPLKITLKPALEDDDQKNPFDWCLNYFKRKSRIYAIATKIKTFIIPSIRRKLSRTQPSFYEKPIVTEFSDDSIVPMAEYKNIGENFRNDLVEIAELAKKYEKTIIITNVPNDESRRPFFSVLNQSLSDELSRKFDFYYNTGLKHYEEQNYDMATEYFSYALDIDPNVAIVNFLLGKCYLEQNETEKARTYLRRSIDYDGYFIRSISLIHDEAKSVAAEKDNVFFVDLISYFHKAIDDGMGYSDLFSDPEHPTMLGHIIIARKIFSEITGIEPFASQNSDFDAGIKDYKAELEHYNEVLSVGNNNIKVNALAEMRWNQGMSDSSFYKEEFYDYTAYYIEKYYNYSEKTPYDQALVLVFEGLNEAKIGNNAVAVDKLNEAYALSQKDTLAIMKGALTTGAPIGSELEDRGISFDKESEKYFIKKDS